jgi:hypothetical protein
VGGGPIGPASWAKATAAANKTSKIVDAGFLMFVILSGLALGICMHVFIHIGPTRSHIGAVLLRTTLRCDESFDNTLNWRHQWNARSQVNHATTRIMEYMLSSVETPDIGETPSPLKILLSSGSLPDPAFRVTFAVLAMILVPYTARPRCCRSGPENRFKLS